MKAWQIQYRSDYVVYPKGPVIVIIEHSADGSQRLVKREANFTELWPEALRQIAALGDKFVSLHCESDSSIVLLWREQ